MMPAPLADQVVATPKSRCLASQSSISWVCSASRRTAISVTGVCDQRGVIPDLRWSAISANEQAWDQVVREVRCKSRAWSPSRGTSQRRYRRHSRLRDTAGLAGGSQR
ncbi:MAG: hypothetical protein CM15mP103_09960 [Gammaproteobacteria bacterium]|nr:MAG: hypothetical protein CM15mP103_09960 [Gammaproteobacteria bacterium]